MRALAVFVAMVAALATGVAGFVSGATLERQTRAAEAAALSASVSAAAPPDVGPLGPYARATLMVRCYEAAGRAGNEPRQSSILLGACVKYVESLR